MPREKVEYSANLPTIIELDGPGILQANGRGDEEYRYMLRDERITWVPPAVHAQITASGADYPGAAFQITKHQLKARAPITWEVKRVDPPIGYGYATQPPVPPPPAQPHEETHMERTAQGWTQRGPVPAAAQRQPTAQAQPPRATPQPAAQLAADAPELPTTGADRMAQCLKDAIDLARGARSYAPEIAWSAGDIRALAATLFIDGGRK